MYILIPQSTKHILTIFFLFLDLQFSTDDEEFEEVENSEEQVVSTLSQGESSIKMHLSMGDSQEAQMMQGMGEDDSQQAAEAMVQLSGIGFYNQSQGGDDSIDMDNYDPSDFLSMANRNIPSAASSSSSQMMMPPPPPQQQQQQQSQPIYDNDFKFTTPIEYKYDPQAMQFTPMHQVSYDYQPNLAQSYEQMGAEAAEEPMQYEITDDQQQHQPSQVEEEVVQQQHHHQQLEQSEQEYQDFAQSIKNIKQERNTGHEEGQRPLHDDLAISDSDDEGTGGGQGQHEPAKMEFKQEQQPDDDGDGLWF